MVTFGTVSDSVPVISNVPSGNSITLPGLASISAVWTSFSKLGPAEITPSFLAQEVSKTTASNTLSNLATRTFMESAPGKVAYHLLQYKREGPHCLANARSRSPHHRNWHPWHRADGECGSSRRRVPGRKIRAARPASHRCFMWQRQ